MADWLLRRDGVTYGTATHLDDATVQVVIDGDEAPWTTSLAELQQRMSLIAGAELVRDDSDDDA